MKSIQEQMQELIPGSTTFPSRVLCPKCGWHFKAGLTDPSGQTSELVPGAHLICGQCMSVLKVNQEGNLAIVSAADIAALSSEDLQLLSRMWQLTFIARTLGGGPEVDQPGPRQ